MNKNKLFASVIGLLVFVAGLSAKDYQVAMFGIKSAAGLFFMWAVI